MGLFDFLGLNKAAVTPPQEALAVATTNWPQGAVAQLVGGSAISPLFDPGYPLDHYLPTLLALHPDDAPPKIYKSVTGSPEQKRYVFDENILHDLTGSFSYTVSNYNREAYASAGLHDKITGPYHQFLWNEVRMKQLAIVAGFTPERTVKEGEELWRDAYLAYGENTKPGSVTIASGKAGWTTLETGLAKIATPDAKVIWLGTVDSPSYPKDKLPNEAAVLLMLAHPGFVSGRAPLAYFTAPAVVPVKEIERVKGEKPRVTALRLAVEQVCATAGITTGSIGTVVRDCGRHTPEAAQRLADTGAALHDLLPDYDLLKEAIDLPAVLDELGANTVNYSMLLAAYAANQRRHPVLYLSSRDPDAGRAMLILPNPAPVENKDPGRLDREAFSRSQWYRPWWGQRLDGMKDF
ncbi:MAG: hypothetical protein KGP14_11830 [Betaproteobacteria bacterium]|nr:hypothetical protein [Betaproteobacteria bacterium]